MKKLRSDAPHQDLEAQISVTALLAIPKLASDAAEMIHVPNSTTQLRAGSADWSRREPSVAE
jgi:hypothetical protein